MWMRILINKGEEVDIASAISASQQQEPIRPLTDSDEQKLLLDGASIVSCFSLFAGPRWTRGGFGRIICATRFLLMCLNQTLFRPHVVSRGMAQGSADGACKTCVPQSTLFRLHVVS